MTSSSNPTWYDVLGVSRDASPAEIKAAWRLATDKFEPGTGAGQFRMFNEAADVLLDPVRRADYDASLQPTAAVGAPADVLAPAVTSEDASVPAASGEEPAEPAPSRSADRARRRQEKRAAKASLAAESQPASRRTMVAAGVLGVLAVAAIVVAVILGLQSRTDARVADARQQAPAAAERAAQAIFSYDYRQMPADLARAKQYLTPSFAKDFTDNFDLLVKQKDGTPGPALQTKTVVKSDVPATAVVDAEAGVVRVLAYVNMTSTRPGRSPQVFQNRVTLKMVKHGDRWLVDKVDTF